MFFNSLAYRFGIRCFLSSAKQFKSKPNLRRASGKCKSQWHFGIRFSKPKAVVKCSKNRCTSANKVSGTTTALDATSSNSISGLSISIKADTTLSAEGSLSAEFKSGLKATFDGGVMGEVKGAIVKVN